MKATSWMKSGWARWHSKTPAHSSGGLLTTRQMAMEYTRTTKSNRTKCPLKGQKQHFLSGGSVWSIFTLHFRSLGVLGFWGVKDFVTKSIVQKKWRGGEGVSKIDQNWVTSIVDDPLTNMFSSSRLTSWWVPTPRSWKNLSRNTPKASSPALDTRCSFDF